MCFENKGAMKVFFRVDASVIMGSGHVMRCLTLAEKLREQGADVSFICRAHSGNMIDWIKTKHGFKTYILPVNYDWKLPQGNNLSVHAEWLGTDSENDALQTKKILFGEGIGIEWLIVDHYALDVEWERMLSPYVKKIMVIDDLADRYHHCDLLLDQNLYKNLDERYNNLVSASCQKLLGPKYALLRKEFYAARKNLRQRDGTIKRILIFFGGSDPTNETIKALAAIKLLNRPDIAVDVVVGKTNRNKQQVERLCNSLHNVLFYCNVENMAYLMSIADLAIGAGGTSTWERCCLGLPSLMIALAHNQVAIAETSGWIGIGVYLGLSESVSPYIIKLEIEKLLYNKRDMINASIKAIKLVDGQGVDRVVFNF